MIERSATKLSRGVAEPKVLRRLLATETAAAFTAMIWREIREERAVYQTHQGDLLKKNAIEVHGRNCPAILGLHWGLTPLVANETQCDLLPSFAFFRVYFEGDVCRVHSDRAACQVSLSLTLAYSNGRQWDLSVGTSATFDRTATDDFGEEPYKSYVMEPGDGLLYNGSARRHGRIQPNPNKSSAHLFLQWVDRDGPYQSEAFERLEVGGAVAI